MRRVWVWPLLALLLLAAQTAWRAPWEVAGVRPDFLLLSALLVAMRHGWAAGAAWGTALGALQDVFSVGPPGMHLLSKGLLGLAVGSLRGQLDCENPNTQSLVALGGTVAKGAVALLVLEGFAAGLPWAVTFAGTILPEAVLHGVLLPCGPALGRVARARLGRRLARQGGPPALRRGRFA